MGRFPQQTTPTNQLVRRFAEPASLRQQVRRWKQEGHRVALVPTMGALHAGHLSLVKAAFDAGATRVIASIFVNPTQFAAGEDLSTYPRDTDLDVGKLGNAGVHAVFLPSVGTMYPAGSRTNITVGGLSQVLCGRSRPTHFGGVATVVALLFNIVQPDVAVFGEKDFQQLQVIRRLTADLHLPVEIVAAPIVREFDGLAMSSRNAYLTADQRMLAPLLFEAMGHARSLVLTGERDPAVLVGDMRAICERAGTVDYVMVVDDNTLQEATVIGPSSRVALAVQVGRARLIDNCSLWPT
ncbi:MAG: pantoate--beta-alanine ligase [Myxococcota bacterium]|jgi:pantoate--beta-alanine ligase